MVKVWNITDEELEGSKRNVSMVTSRDLGVVRLLSSIAVTSYLDSPHRCLSFLPLHLIRPFRGKYFRRHGPPTTLSLSPPPDQKQNFKSGMLQPTSAHGRRSERNWLKLGGNSERRQVEALSALSTMMREITVVERPINRPAMYLRMTGRLCKTCCSLSIHHLSYGKRHGWACCLALDSLGLLYLRGKLFLLLSRSQSTVTVKVANPFC